MNEVTPPPASQSWPRRHRLLLIIIGVIIAFIVAIRLTLRSQWLLETIRSKVVAAADSSINGSVHIRKLSGDLWNHVDAIDVNVIHKDTLIHLDTLHISYSILKNIIHPITLSAIDLHGLSAQLRKPQGGSWNFRQLVTSDTTDTSSSGFPFSHLSIRSFVLDRSDITVFAPEMVPDSGLTISQLSLRAAFGWSKSDGKYDLRLPQLAFNMRPGRSHESIHLETGLSATDRRYDLDRLIIASARSLLEGNGFFENDSLSPHFAAHMNGQPINPGDIRPFYPAYPLKENLNFQLEAAGDLQNVQITLTASSDDLKKLNIKTGISVKPQLEIRRLDVSMDGGNLSALTGDTTLPSISRLRLSAAGEMPVNNWRQSRFTADLSVAGLTDPDFRVEQAGVNLSVDSLKATLQAHAASGSGKLMLEAQAQHPFDSLRADWQARLSASGIRPDQWMASAGPSLSNTRISATLKAHGTGWQPSSNPWQIELVTQPSQINGQRLGLARLHAGLTDSLIKAQGALSLAKSTLTVNGSYRYADPVPTYHLDLQGKRINLADMEGFAHYPTALYLDLHVDGRGFQAGSRVLAIHLTADSSIINNEKLDHMVLDARLRNQLLDIDNLKIQSAIADASFKGNILLNNLLSQTNRLHYVIELKDIHSLAPLAGTENLQARGDMTGDLSSKNGVMNFTSSFHLNDIEYAGTTIGEANGRATVQLTGRPHYDLYTELKAPAFNGVTLRDFRLSTEGETDSTYSRFGGHYDIALQAHPGSGSGQKGVYYVAPDSIRLGIRSFYIETPLRRLSLIHDASIIYADSTLRSDTLALASTDGALVSLHVARLDQQVQQGSFRAEKLNLGAIQNLFLGRQYIDGIISGGSTVDIQGDSVLTHTHLLMSDLTFSQKQLTLDTLRLDLDIDHNQLTSSGFIRDKGITLLQESVSLPFRTGNPATFDTAFFEKPVKGSLMIKPIDLSRFSSELKELGWQKANGIFSFTGTLSGKAGSPDLEGSLLLQGSQFSGVPIDSLRAGFSYKHSEHKMHLFARLISQNQEALAMRGEAPLLVDLKNFEVTLPGGNDSLKAQVTSSNFNLQALDGLVMPEMASGLKGLLNSRIYVGGTYDRPLIHGFLNLSEAGVTIRPANIKLENMEMALSMNPDSLVLKKLHVHSGDGDLNAAGQVDLNGFQPGQFHLTMTSKNFQVFNTRVAKAAVSLNTQLKGTTVRPVLTGDVRIDHADIYPTRLSTNNVEVVHLNAENQDTTSQALYDSLSMNLSVKMPADVWLRSRGSPEMSIEMTGDLQLTKHPAQDLQVFGTLKSRRGYVKQLGKKFILDTGELTFNGAPANPHLNIKATYQLRHPSDISIYYMITGTLENPEFNYDSDPQMNLENIVSYTLFGRPFNSLLSWQQSAAGSESGRQVVQNAALNLLLNKVEGLATDRLGIDMIEVNSSGSNGGSGTTIKMGKYISDRVFVAIQHQIGSNEPGNEIILQYYINPDLELMLTQGNNAQSGIDIQWTHDY